MITKVRSAALAALVLAAACGGDEEQAAPPPEPQAPTAQQAANARARAVQVAWNRRMAAMTPEEMNRARMDMSWQEVVQLDPATGPDIPNPEKWEQITAQTVNTAPQHVPLHGDVGGPSVLRTQILLDRALFSPGIMDGRWGKNTAEALYWFQHREGLRKTARLDSATFQRLRQAAGNPQELVVRKTMTEEDVKGPFTEIPEDIYEHAKLECSCYESLTEKLSETYHATPDLLQKLNPGVDLDAVRAGQQLYLPAVREEDASGRGQVAKLVVSGRGTYVHAMDSGGRILYHFPSTLGGSYSPSPTGAFKVNGVARDPEWHYQPDILVGVPDNEPDAMIPAGPNVAVGAVWIDLSEPHYGIHGTSEPQTIGYASSNGCVRLTNWDVKFLSRYVRAGVPVEFRDISGTKVAEDPANAGTSSAAPATGRSGTAAPATGRSGSAGAAATGTRTGTGGAARTSTGTGRASGTDAGTPSSRTRRDTSASKSNETPKSRETPKASETPKADEHAGHTP
ncbi:MAG TPA: L,D-transpeptidase [Longimicrobium sp.]|nr:L,D-transpeptidase [Longimicrobium sp.]